MRNYDLEFLKHFSMVIGFLVLVTLGLIGTATWLHGARPVEEDPARVAQIAARLEPAGAVYAGETGAAALAAAQEAARAAAASQVAYGGSTDGAMIFANLCGACHQSGAGGAPKLEKAAWSARIAQGEETLIRHAIEGFQGAAGIMPPRGGNPALSDEQVAATVRWMLENLK
ncbi:MAG: cytochrome c [Lysobacteraceae bacterium]|nr:MAG: cytochrome c [Xanthomonadaceae bacterium]